MILVAGASGLGRPAREAVHRPERFCELAGLPLDGAVTARALAAVIRAEALAGKVFFNQVEGREDLDNAWTLAGLLDVAVLCRSAAKGALDMLVVIRARGILPRGSLCACIVAVFGWFCVR